MMKYKDETQYPLLSKWILFAFAISFLVLGMKLILFDPIIGLANNGDFWRNMSEVGLWFCDSGTIADCQIPYDQMYFGFTINRYFYIVPYPSGFWTPYVIFLAFSRWLSHLVSPSQYDIRFIGTLNLLLYWLGVTTLISQIRVPKKLPLILQFVLAIGLALFVSDSYILQYFNSFYAEPISLISTIWFFALFLAIRNHKAEKIKNFLFLIQLLVGIFTASVKQQDMLTIFPIVAITLIELYYFVAPEIKGFRVMRLLVGFFIAIGMIGSVFYIAEMNNGGDFMGEYNAIMSGLLPYSSKQEQLLTSLGFSANQAKELVPFIGQTLFENDISSKYPDFFSRSGEIKIILADPLMLVKSLVARSKNIYTDVTFGNFQLEDNMPPYSKLGGYSRTWWYLTQVLISKSLAFYLFIIVVSIVIGGIQLHKFGFHPRYLLLVILSFTNIFRFIVVMLGDVGDDKHLYVTNIEFFVIFLLLIYCVIQLIERALLISDSRINVLIDNNSSLQ